MKNELKKYLTQLSIIKGDFILSSGEKSNYYIDARLCTLSSKPLSIITSIFYQKIIQFNINYVGGPTIGADPIVGALLQKASDEKYNLSGFLARSTDKKHGTKKLIEGPDIESKDVVLVEDVVSTGGSLIKVIEELKNLKCNVNAILSIVDREMNAEKKFKDLNINYYPIFKVSELL